MTALAKPMAATIQAKEPDKGEAVVSVKNASKKFCKNLRRSMAHGIVDLSKNLVGIKPNSAELRKDEFWALDNISFELRKGEALGLIGVNGSGKTTLLRLLAGIFPPDKGEIMVKGRVGALIAVGAGFHPYMTGRENIYLNGAILGMSREEIDSKFNDIVDFAEIGDFLEAPVSTYSSGMRVRLGFSIAAQLEPDLLLVDEILAVGDLGFRRKCVTHMMDYLQKGRALVLVSHNMHLVQSICNRCLLLEQGQIEFVGTTTEGVRRHFESRDSYSAQITNEQNLGISDGEPIIIEKLDIHPTKGDEIRSGKGVRLSLHYRSTEHLGAVFWNFSIWTGDQWNRIATGRSRFSNVKYRIVEGRGRFECTIHHLPLVAGTYAVKAAILDPRTKCVISSIGWTNMPAFFTVKSLGNEIDNRRTTDNELVIIEVDWK